MESGEDHGDLLDTMLKGRDPKTGKGLTPENIRYQLVTFLIAGHEVGRSHELQLTSDNIRSPFLLVLLPSQASLGSTGHP